MEIRRHIFQVSSYQMCLLMLFNRQERWTYEVCKYVNQVQYKPVNTLFQLSYARNWQ